ncbi:MAG: hypothetical protein Tsb002_05800 [Wenzhouxiangellaceae bacterium]
MSQICTTPMSEPTDWCARLEAYLYEHIPLCASMALKASITPQHELCLSAPLNPNRNDKGSGFGGSIAALLTIAGWSVIWIECQRQKVDCDLVIRQSQLRYHQPAYDELQACCAFPGPGEWQQFVDCLDRRGLARIERQQRLFSGGLLASSMTAEYAGVRPG